MPGAPAGADSLCEFQAIWSQEPMDLAPQHFFKRMCSPSKHEMISDILRIPNVCMYVCI
jgi:hypothetical protein